MVGLFQERWVQERVRGRDLVASCSGRSVGPGGCEAARQNWRPPGSADAAPDELPPGVRARLDGRRSAVGADGGSPTPPRVGRSCTGASTAVVERVGLGPTVHRRWCRGLVGRSRPGRDCHAPLSVAARAAGPVLCPLPPRRPHSPGRWQSCCSRCCCSVRCARWCRTVPVDGSATPTIEVSRESGNITAHSTSGPPLRPAPRASGTGEFGVRRGHGGEYYMHAHYMRTRCMCIVIW